MFYDIHPRIRLLVHNGLDTQNYFFEYHENGQPVPRALSTGTSYLNHVSKCWPEMIWTPTLTWEEKNTTVYMWVGHKDDNIMNDNYMKSKDKTQFTVKCV